jgi:hypothetical protein
MNAGAWVSSALLALPWFQQLNVSPGQPVLLMAWLDEHHSIKSHALHASCLLQYPS